MSLAERDVIAMHGWAGDGGQWEPWLAATAPLGWHWTCGERGYGDRAPRIPSWSPRLSGATRPPRLLIVHSLGLHLLPPPVLAAADAVVLLASFAGFLPPPPAQRRLAAALNGMAAQLEDADGARSMLRAFLAKAAAPDPPELMAPGPADGPLGAANLERLRRDLEQLRLTSGLPEGFPAEAAVLIVEAEHDAIVVPESRAQLRDLLPRAEVRLMAGAGHALLQAPLVETMHDWLSRRAG